MGRKETIWGARHTSEQKEIERIIQNYKEQYNIDLTILEASAIQAERSMDMFWPDKKARDAIKRLRGIF